MFTNNDNWKIVDSYNSAYWSGLDVEIYVGGIHLSDAIQVSYQISEQVRPYYGYASYVPDRVYHGARLITGELTLNFKKDGYLFSFLQSMRTEGLTQPNKVNFASDGPIMDENNDPFTDSSITLQSLKDSGLNPEIARDVIERRKYKRELEEIDVLDPTIKNNAGIFETTIDGFDLTIILGDRLKDSSLIYWDPNDDSFRRKPIGSVTDGYTNHRDHPQKISTPATGKRIVGVSIMGYSQMIADDGRSLVETYSFMARNIDIVKKFNPTKPLTQSHGTTIQSDRGYLLDRSTVQRQQENF